MADMLTVSLFLWKFAMMAARKFRNADRINKEMEVHIAHLKSPVTFRPLLFWRALIGCFWPAVLIAVVSWYAAHGARSEPVDSAMIFRIVASVACVQLMVVLGAVDLVQRWKNFDFHK